ncbi:hypothetical protein ILUMI_00662 [Ignelater luminosus]|uniref:Uncharacterized protein n=1 Tax=Ignelater luminosus TaxID=2038154 RepID=A0A8K0DJR9_IGNLU|nr:hypothetical protein ILUMI_00662 [Ignelater luminosus]
MDLSKHIKPLSSKTDCPMWEEKIRDLFDYHKGALNVIDGKLKKPDGLASSATKDEVKKHKEQCDLFVRLIATQNPRLPVLKSASKPGELVSADIFGPFSEFFRKKDTQDKDDFMSETEDQSESSEEENLSDCNFEPPEDYEEPLEAFSKNLRDRSSLQKPKIYENFVITNENIMTETETPDSYY